MTPERWEKVSELFHAAAELHPAERDQFLTVACGGDRELRTEVESLLAAESQAGDFIANPIFPESVSAQDETEPWSYIGGELGHYRIERSIGSGGMGDVYLATDTRLNRRVAIKTLPTALAKSPAFLKRFRNEAQAAANLNHPNVATIFSVEEIDGRPIITMEYVEGKVLSEVTPSGGLDLRTFLDWFVPISDALCHAHERGIVHRDIKPGNIMITSDGIPKVLDFGLAQMEFKAGDVTEFSITQPGQIVGTPSYMSPEQAQGKDVDERSDIFSFGVVMFEALTGERPFKGGSNAEVVSNVLKSDPPSISGIRPELPAVLEKLIDRCLVKSPRGRIQKMSDVNSILSDLWVTLTRGTGRDSSLRRLYREFNPASPRWMIAAGFLILVAAVGAWMYFSPRQVISPVRFADLTFKKLSQANNIVYAHITPDGRSIIYNAIDEEDRRSLWVRLIDDRNALELVPPQRVQYWGGMAISADSSQIYYITADWAARFGTLYRISALGGSPRKLIDGVNDLGSLSHDGNRIYFVRYGETIDILSAKAADGSDEQVIHSVEPGNVVRDPQLSADGAQLFFSKVENVGLNELWSLIEIPAGGGPERVVIQPQKQRINDIAVLRDGRGIIINQEDQFSNLNQLFFVDTSSGSRTRITNDLSSYFGVSVSADGNSIVTAERRTANHVVVGEASDPASFRTLTSEPTAYRNVQWSNTGRIVYDAADSNVPHIWSVLPDGTDAQQLTPNDSSDHQPVVSPDGSVIVFTSDRSGERKVWRMNADGSTPMLLTALDGQASDPRITPDGGSVIFKWRRGNSESLGRVPINGGDPVELPMYGETYWAYSHDGTRVAYALREDLRQPSRVAVRRLIEPEPYQILEISPIHIFKWDSKDTGLIFRDRQFGRDPFSTVWFIDLGNMEKKVIYDGKSDTVLDLSFSPDGKRIAVVQGKLITDAVMLTKIKPQ
jgi:eukaryotic-like serine/threonine-protein kinase